jgi:hypothetical protein
MSTLPSATMTCDQKSPYARVRHTERARPRKVSSRPAASHSDRSEYDREASWSLPTPDTWQLVAADRLRPVQVPLPRAAHQRRPIAGADTTPATTSSPSISAMSVAHTGTPRT